MANGANDCLIIFQENVIEGERQVTVQDIFLSRGLTLEMKGMCILVYGLMSLIST